MTRQIVTPGEIEIDGKKFIAVFDFEAIAEAEDITGKPLLMGLTRRQIDQPSINFVRAMFFAAIHRHQPKVSCEEAAELVTRENIADLWRDILECWVDCQKQEDGVQVPNPPEAAPAPMADPSAS